MPAATLSMTIRSVFITVLPDAFVEPSSLLEALVPGPSGRSTGISVDCWLDAEPDRWRRLALSRQIQSSARRPFGAVRWARANSSTFELIEQREHHETIRLIAWRLSVRPRPWDSPPNLSC
jgi:hypothetical protein